MARDFGSISVPEVNVDSQRQKTEVPLPRLLAAARIEALQNGQAEAASVLTQLMALAIDTEEALVTGAVAPVLADYTRRKVADDLYSLLIRWVRMGGEVALRLPDPEIKLLHPLPEQVEAAAADAVVSAADRTSEHPAPPAEPPAALDEAATPPAPAVETAAAVPASTKPSRPPSKLSLNILKGKLEGTPDPAASDAKARFAEAEALGIKGEIDWFASWTGDGRDCERLQEIESHLLVWLYLRDEARLLLFNLLFARLRHMQHAFPGSGPLVTEAILAAIRAMHEQKRHKDFGYVHGPERHARPKHGSWKADIRHLTRELRGLAGLDEPEPAPKNPEKVLHDLRQLIAGGAEAARAVAAIEEALQTVRPDHPKLLDLCDPFLEVLEDRVFSRLRKEIRRRREKPASAEAGDPYAELRPPPDWPGYEFTKGKRGLIVGGVPRPEQCRTLQEVFGFSVLDWETTLENDRILQSVGERIRARRYDLVLLTRWTSHKATPHVNDPCKEMGTPCLFIHNYSVALVRLAVETKLVTVEPDEGEE
jgi:hypothetical protein